MASLCGCGCGGKHWLLLLRDTDGAIRRYAATVEEMTDHLPARLAAHPALREKYDVLAGQPMTRLKCTCRKYGGDPMPDLAHYVGLEDGVPVYDPHRRAAAVTA